jgi:hypothetical protein
VREPLGRGLVGRRAEELGRVKGWWGEVAGRLGRALREGTSGRSGASLGRAMGEGMSGVSGQERRSGRDRFGEGGSIGGAGGGRGSLWTVVLEVGAE